MKFWLKKYNFYTLISLFFLLSRYIYYTAGVRFDIKLLGRGWQYLDVELLKNNLLESLSVLHSQPPLMNLFLGLVLKLPENWHYEVFHIFYLLIGLLTALMIADTMRKLGVSAILSLVITVIFICSPASILYENWLFYSHFETFFLIAIIWATINYFTKNESKKYLLILFITVAALCLTRSLFHLAFFVAIIAFIFFSSKNKRRVLYTSIFPFLSVLLWYLKNLFLFGTFNASSWFGMNFAKLSYNWDTPLGKTGIWGRPELYDSLYHFPVLSWAPPALANWHKQNNECNYNYFGYIQVSNDFKKDATLALKKHPEIYWKNVQAGISIFFEPTEQIRYAFLEDNGDRIRPVCRLYNWGYEYPYGEIGSELIWINAIIYMVIFIGSIILLFIYRKSNTAKIVALILFISIYIFFIGNMFELFENNRFRFPTIPLFMMLLALQINFALKGFRQKT